MRKTQFAAGLILIFCFFFGCQTLKVQKSGSPLDQPGPEGVYLANASTPQGDIQFTLTINSDGTGLVESMMGNQDVTDIKTDGNSFDFDAKIQSQMGEMELTFKGVVEGDNIKGTIGTQMGSLSFSGTRK